jgi:diaminopimelate decarboxylase
MNIADLHIHTGSEIKDVDVFVKGIEVLFDIVPHFKELKFIDLGGGFKFRQKDFVETDINALAEKVGDHLRHMPRRAQVLPGLV